MLRFKNRISLHCLLACAYFLMLPLTITTNSFGSSFLKLAAVPIGAYFLISIVFYKQELRINMVHITMALFTLATLVTLFVDSSADSLFMISGYFLNAGLYICLSVVPFNDKELRWLENVQVILLVIISVLVLTDNLVGEAGRETLTIFGQKSDPNYFVGFLIFPLSVTMKKIVESKWRIFYILLAFTSVYMVLLSGSRGGLLAVVATVVAFSLIYPKGFKTKFIVQVLR